MHSLSNPLNRPMPPDDSPHAASPEPVLRDPPASPVVLRIAAGDAIGQYVGIDADRFTIGASTSCDVSFPEYRASGLAKRAAKVRREADGWVLRPVGGAVMFVNSTPADDKQTLRSGDVVRLSVDGPEFQFLVQHQNQRALREIAGDYAPQLIDALRAPEAVPEPAADPATAPTPAAPTPTVPSTQSGGAAPVSEPRPEPIGAAAAAPVASPSSATIPVTLPGPEPVIPVAMAVAADRGSLIGKTGRALWRWRVPLLATAGLVVVVVIVAAMLAGGGGSPLRPEAPPATEPPPKATPW